MEDKLEFAKFMRDKGLGLSDREFEEWTLWCFENKRFLTKHDMPDSAWSLMGLWFELFLRRAREAPAPSRPAPPEMRTTKKRDEDLTDEEYRETLYVTCRAALTWTDWESFRDRVRSLARRAPLEDPDAAETFAALWEQVLVARALRRGSTEPPWRPTEGYREWLRVAEKETMAKLDPPAREFSLRPGERERFLRQNLDTRVTDWQAVMEKSRSPMAVFYPEKSPLSAPRGTRERNAAVLATANAWFKAKGGFEFWSHAVLSAEDYFADAVGADPDEPVVVQNLGRFDVLHRGVLYETEDAETAIFNWCALTERASSITRGLAEEWRRFL